MRAASHGRGTLRRTSKVLRRIRAVPLDAHSHQTTDVGGGVKWKSSAECCLKPGGVGAGPASGRRGRLTVSEGRSDATKAVGEIIEVSYRSFDMRDRMAYTRQPRRFASALQSEDAALFHLECEILELSLALDAHHCRVAWFKLSHS